jgi:hypothetical protein
VVFVSTKKVCVCVCVCVRECVCSGMHSGSDSGLIRKETRRLRRKLDVYSRIRKESAGGCRISYQPTCTFMCWRVDYAGRLWTLYSWGNVYKCVGGGMSNITRVRVPLLGYAFTLRGMQKSSEKQRIRKGTDETQKGTRLSYRDMHNSLQATVPGIRRPTLQNMHPLSPPLTIASLAQHG